MYFKRLITYAVIIGIVFNACKKKPDDSNPVVPPEDTIDYQCSGESVDVQSINDTYYDKYSFDYVYQWGPYNVHDPSVIFNQGCFYCISTDVMYGLSILRSGLQIRASHDLFSWEFKGWVFKGLPSLAVDYITSNGSTPVDNVWAPYIVKINNEFRLYYFQASNTAKLSAIGLATSKMIKGPWIEKGLVVTSNENITMPNAIDPTVIVDNSDRHWMFYGSSWDGIYILALNPETGLAKTSGSKGKRIAHRGFTNNVMNGNIEAPEIIYNAAFNKYYLFISYDWLETKYNVRVGRADKVDGPYYDYNGTDLNTYADNIPMIIAPYAFAGHSGWQGTGHCSVFESNGQYYIAHQGRPAVNKYFMDLHVRRLLWTEDGWPVVSPERYAGIEITPVNADEIPGQWERIEFKYTVVPGFAETQTSADIQKAVKIALNNDGTISENADDKWSFENQTLQLTWSNGTIDKVIVERGWDWENKKETILFTGLNNKGTAIWGKKSQ